MALVAQVTVEKVHPEPIAHAPLGRSLGLDELGLTGPAATFWTRTERFYVKLPDGDPQEAQDFLKQRLDRRLQGTLWTLDPILIHCGGEAERLLQRLQTGIPVPASCEDADEGQLD